MPSGLYTPSSELEPIVGIQFGIFSPEEIERRSVVEITSHSTYDGNEPKIGGLFDPRMGILDNGKQCRSCGQTNHHCPGHFGHYRLARPVYYIQFFSKVLNVLRCVCIRCSKLLIDKNLYKNLAKRRGESRWREVLNACGNITRCGQQIEDGCGARQPDRYVKEGIARVIAEWDDAEGKEARPDGVEPQKMRQPLEVEYILRLFRQIIDEDVDFMGLSRHWCRPDWMICSTLSVPPPQMRPSVVQDNNQRSEDDLTHKLVDIIKTNKTLQQKIDANASKGIIDEWTNVLQYHIATLIDNQIPGVAQSAQRSGRTLKSIQQRLGSKEGRIRYNIQGKRVEFSARSVITPDPNLSIGELGVPMKIAMNLTFPEKVTPYNRDLMYKYVQNGADTYPGAKTLVRADGRMISLKHVNTKELTLYNGDTVNRHIMDGDIILFNRQPTLHRMSMMGHRARVLPYNTFRLNVSAVSPYNADFDGDEMNAHIPQSYEAATELEQIAAVKHQIIGPREGKPSIGIVQDTLVGTYRITKDDKQFTRREYMNLMMYNKNFEGLPKPGASAAAAPGGERWTGHQVVSSLLPPINMDMGNKSFDDDPSARNKVKIVEGQILNGIIDKDIFSKAGKGIVHVSYNDYGSDQTVDMIDSMQLTIESFLVLNGFSVGISDMIADDKTRQQMDEVIQARKKEVNELNLQVHLDLFDNNTGKSNQDEFEARVFASLNKATKESGEFGQLALADENRLVAMVKAGSKGGPINIAQMIACVGQQNIEGRRIPYGFSDRTLPHYKKYDDGPEARGFIESSFIGGLSPQEFFFHAMSGREGLIDTAVKTADTGYIQRQLVKAMEDLTVQHDGTVRDANMNIVQFHYGEDGLNATKIEGTSIGYAKLSEKDIRREFGLAKVDFTPILTDAVISTDATNYAQTAEMKTYVEQILEDRKMIVEGVFSSGRQGGVFGPLNPERLIMNLRIRFGLKSDLKTDLTPTYLLQGLNKLIERTQPYHKLWCALIRFHFAPHKLIVKDRFTKAAFDALMELCLLKNLKASSLPGELVGIIAAQSIGEPSTQMCCVYSSRIAVRNVKTNEHFVGPIGKLIDDILEYNKSNLIQIGENNVVLDLDMENGYEIIGVSNDEKISWKKISQVSRHPANGGLVEITTKSGRKTTATLTHSFLTRGPKGVIPILGSELKVGTRVPIARQIPEVASPLYSLTVDLTTFELTKEFGWLCGIYLADGSLNGNTVRICKIHPIVEEKIRAIGAHYNWDITVMNYNGAYGPGKDTNIHSKDLKQFLSKHFSTGSYEKKIAAPVFQSNVAFIQGIIAGYFDGDGNVNVERQQIRVGSRSKTLVHDIAALLSYCGIFGAFGEETSIRIPGKILYTYQILKKYAAQFRTTIGLHLNEKAAALDAIVDYMERDGKHDTKEIYDKIPELGETIAETGRLLTMPGQSRNFGRWAKKESIGRLTLKGYIEDFEEVLATRTLDAQTESTVRENIAALRSAAYSDIVWDEIVDLNILEDPKEFVYDFTVPGNDSFMVDDNILVHNTLNSVDYDTEIIIMKNGKVWTPEIGEFIDNYYEALPEDSNVVQKLPNNQVYIELNDGNDWKALSTDEDGKMMWTKLEAITRHPVVNEDGSNTILEVELESGRIIKATKALSFLTNVDGKVEGIKGSDLKVGDEIPIANSLDIGEYIIKEINLRDILPPTEWLYGTDVNKALEIMREYNSIGDRHWFQINQGKLFTVPYNRSDTFRDAFENGRNTNTVKDGCVYPKRTRPDTSHIPETISLTGDFGFFVGAYVAEGMSNSTQINITNNDAEYIQKVKDLMDKWNVGTHIVSEDRFCEKTGIKGHTTSLVIHSTLLAKIMGYYFGKVSYEKTLPDWVLQASDEFVKGLVDGYISGDGCVSSKTGGVSASSVSKILIVKIMALLARYGIFSTMYSYTPQLKKFNSVSTQYSFRILAKYSKVFAETFTLSIVNKQEKLEYHFMYNDNERTCMREYQNNIVWDKVKSIKEVLPLRGWVYDLTVEKTRHFTGLNLINLYDTFHLAGVAAKSNVTRGVPRLKELLKVTENPKAISITGYLKPEFRQNKDKVREVVQDLELTLLRDITIKAAIYYDPSDTKTIVSEDSELIQFYKLFEERENEAAPTDDGVKWSNWLVRLELDRERMFNKNISMDDISFILNDRFSENISLVYSDFNSKKLIMRIRLTTDEKTLGFGDDLAGIKKFQNKILNGIVIRGVPGIRSATFRKHADLLEYVDGEYKPIEQYVIDTDGSNFLEVMNHPAIDGTRIYTTHVHDIYNNLGVEAARAVLMSELVGLFEEAGVNYRHLGLLCDVMTHKGRFMMVARYGINKNDIGPLAKASFEETEKILLNAALFGEVDPITGVSANIMTGQAIRAGTSFSQILLDESALGRLLQGLPPTEEGEEEEEGAELTQAMINSELYEDSNDACATTQLRMNIAIPGDIPILEEPDGELTILE